MNEYMTIDKVIMDEVKKSLEKGETPTVKIKVLIDGEWHSFKYDGIDKK